MDPVQAAAGVGDECTHLPHGPRGRWVGTPDRSGWWLQAWTPSGQRRPRGRAILVEVVASGTPAQRYLWRPAGSGEDLEPALSEDDAEWLFLPELE